MSDTDPDPRPLAPVEFRSVTGDLSVDFAQRTIELIAMPYNAEAGVIVRGRPVIESCAPGAFSGCERRANRVKVNRDHDVQRTVGRAVALHPSRDEGLVAELRIARTPLGDETLALADDQSLEASVGFAVLPSGERWLENRSRRLVTKAFLDHIAMVPEGAYEGRVLSVRGPVYAAGADFPLRPGSPLAQLAEFAAQRPVATPNLDEVLSWWGR